MRWVAIACSGLSTIVLATARKFFSKIEKKCLCIHIDGCVMAKTDEQCLSSSAQDRPGYTGYDLTIAEFPGICSRAKPRECGWWVVCGGLWFSGARRCAGVVSHCFVYDGQDPSTALRMAIRAEMCPVTTYHLLPTTHNFNPEPPRAVGAHCLLIPDP